MAIFIHTAVLQYVYIFIHIAISNKHVLMAFVAFLPFPLPPTFKGTHLNLYYAFIILIATLFVVYSVKMNYIQVLD